MFKVPAKFVEARQHGQTTLQCSAAGSPAPSLTWYKNGEPIIKVINSFSNFNNYYTLI